ncbi:Uncharacterised protein [uncultured archaeon]|nr:Uncharacterised protein [uncultured archaeon]
MAAIQQYTYNDSSNVTTFTSWAYSISNFLGNTAGWTQTADTGQLIWSNISTVPVSGAYVYEIWKKSDDLTPFFLKMEYGNYSGTTNCPTIRATIGTLTNGSGNIYGPMIGPFTTNYASYTANTSIPFDCRYSGDESRFDILMWRNATNMSQQIVGVERSLNANGVYTGDHVTLITGGCINSISQQSLNQATFIFGKTFQPIAQSLAAQSNYSAGAPGGFSSYGVRRISQRSTVSLSWNGNSAISTTAPFIGYYDYPLTIFGEGNAADFPEASIFTTTVYGNTHIYLASNAGNCPYFMAKAWIGSSMLMRYD